MCSAGTALGAHKMHASLQRLQHCVHALSRARAAHAALGYFIAAVSPNMDVANAALPAYVTVLLFFVGLLLRPQDQPSYWRWFSYLDFLKYAWAAQMINQFEGSHAIALDFQTVRMPLPRTYQPQLSMCSPVMHGSTAVFTRWLKFPFEALPTSECRGRDTEEECVRICRPPRAAEQQLQQA